MTTKRNGEIVEVQQRARPLTGREEVGAVLISKELQSGRLAKVFRLTRPKKWHIADVAFLGYQMIQTKSTNGRPHARLGNVHNFPIFQKMFMAVEERCSKPAPFSKTSCGDPTS